MKKASICLTAAVLAGVLAACSSDGNIAEDFEDSLDESAEESIAQSLEEINSLGNESMTESDIGTGTGTEPAGSSESVIIDGISYFVGDTYTFGNYGEGNISWIILDIDGDNVMLLSEYAIENKQFNEELVETSWEDCSVRSWLNSEFIDSAFTEDEIAMILDTDVLSSANPEFGIQSGEDTVDKVFLLSVDEFESLVPEEYRCCLVTDYAWKNNVCRYSPDDYCDWYLRTPGTSEKMVTYVSYNGIAYTPGRDVSFGICGLRPAMWISIADKIGVLSNAN